MQIKQKMWVTNVGGVGGGANVVNLAKLTNITSEPTYAGFDCARFFTTAATANTDFWGSASGTPCGRYVYVTLDFETG